MTPAIIVLQHAMLCNHEDEDEDEDEEKG